MARIQITARISLDESELEESFIQSSGPGGQNVNKVASAVQLRFDTARQFRDQSRNRAEARARLFDMIRAASVVPKKRKPTKPSKASKLRAIEHKKTRSKLKRLRSGKFDI